MLFALRFCGQCFRETQPRTTKRGLPVCAFCGGVFTIPADSVDAQKIKRRIEERRSSKRQENGPSSAERTRKPGKPEGEIEP